MLDISTVQLKITYSWFAVHSLEALLPRYCACRSESHHTCDCPEMSLRSRDLHILSHQRKMRDLGGCRINLEKLMSHTVFRVAEIKAKISEGCSGKTAEFGLYEGTKAMFLLA